MAIKIAATRSEPVPGLMVKFTVTSADDGDGQYELLPILRGYSGISVKTSGTAGAASFKLVYKNQIDGTFEDLDSGAVTVGDELNVSCGVFSEVYLDVSSSDGSTDVDVEASLYHG